MPTDAGKQSSQPSVLNASCGSQIQCQARIFRKSLAYRSSDLLVRIGSRNLSRKWRVPCQSCGRLSHYEHDHPLRPLLHLNFVDALKRTQSAYDVDSLLSPSEYAECCQSGGIDRTQLVHFVDESLRSECSDEIHAADPMAAFAIGLSAFTAVGYGSGARG